MAAGQGAGPTAGPAGGLSLDDRGTGVPYESVSHTADLAFRVWADSRDALFGEAARALTHAMTAADNVEPRETRHVTCEADDIDVLLHDFLAEVLFQFDARRWLVAEVSAVVTPGGVGWHLEAHLRGEPYASDRHPILNVIKAVTYHQLAVTVRDSRWETTVVFDI